jgi:uncharacterized peroxidase-related enzyme
MSWIKTISYGEATGRLKQMYDRIRGPNGEIDNILRVHGLRPHTLEGHMALYKAVLHHFGNTIPKATLETLGVYVSLLNGCEYCVEHHFAGLARLLGDDERAAAIRAALEADDPALAFEGSELAMLRYARALTLTPAGIAEHEVAALREAGLDDGEILEVNQVVSYFAYANRTVLGLGVDTTGDALGLSPGNSESPDDWGHG